ncbi:MAG: hypothetical protein WD649_06470 [Thermoleophilaceae bacterium]
MRVRARRGALTLFATVALVLGAAAPASAGGSLTDNCALIPPLKAAAPIGNAPCPGVRPGALIESDIGSCTMNYVFNGSDGHRYVGTAGHCVIESPATGGDFPERRWAPGEGPVARDGNGNRIGQWAYAVLRDSEEADFSLVRLDPGVSSSPQMCHFGGPTRLNSSQPAVLPPTVLNHFGNGILVGNLSVVNRTTLPARTALALGMPDPAHVYAQGLVVPGDSGSAINSSDGGAVGVVVTTGVHSAGIGSDGVDVGLVGIVRIVPMITRANNFTGTTYTLQTAPQL